MSYQEEYQRWLEEFKDDAATHEELLALEGNEREIEDRFYTMLSFGTAGMRGVLGAGLNRMNVYNVRRATAALAQYILSTPGQAERGVAIAYDSRRFSEEFARQAALTLAARGVRAYLFESLRPVPVLSFTIRHLGTIAGIVITASHNPPEYNGYKVYWEDGGQMPPDRAGEITKLIDQIDYAQAQPMDAGQRREGAGFRRAADLHAAASGRAAVGINQTGAVAVHPAARGLAARAVAVEPSIRIRGKRMLRQTDARSRRRNLRGGKLSYYHHGYQSQHHHKRNPLLSFHPFSASCAM